jgi:hypothetical protein
MLTRIDCDNDLGVQLRLDMDVIANPTSKYVIRDVGGLGPVKAGIATSDLAGQDGKVFQGASVDSRNITLTLGYRPDFGAGLTVQDLRRSLYAHFAPKRAVKMYFWSDDFQTVIINGYVESCEPNIFSEDPEVVVSIICVDPYFTALADTVKNGTCGTNLSWTYEGDVEVGFLWHIVIPGTHTAVSLTNPKYYLNFTNALVLSDVIDINTVPGAKYVKRTRSGTTINALGYLASSVGCFFKIVPGANTVLARLSAGPTACAYTIDRSS